MMRTLWLALLACAPIFAASAQEPVVAAANVDALFTSPDPKLNTNKQATYHILRDLMEAGHWETADRWLTERYLEHNPMVKSGRQGMADFFMKVRRVVPKPIPEKLGAAVVSVAAEGDYVVVALARPRPDPRDPAKSYSSTWFEMWKFVDGKADEHWDPATLPGPGAPPPGAPPPPPAPPAR